MKLILLSAAVDSGLVEARAESLAETCHSPIARAHGYLTDPALRQPTMSDSDGVTTLVGFLRDSEIVPGESHFSIPLHDAALRILLERKMTRLRLNFGDTLRRDHVKFTPVGLAKIMGATDGLVSAFEALKRLPSELQGVVWVKTAKKLRKKNMGWKEALGVFEIATTICQTVLPGQFFLK